MVEDKIERLIEEISKNILDLSTNERRVLAAQIKDLKPQERKKLRYITDRLLIGVKNGTVDGALAALVTGLATALAIGSGGTIPAIAAALAGATVGTASAKNAMDDAFKANDMQNALGKKEINELTKELESILGKPITNIIRAYGRFKFTI